MSKLYTFAGVGGLNATAHKTGDVAFMYVTITDNPKVQSLQLMFDTIKEAKAYFESLNSRIQGVTTN